MELILDQSLTLSIDRLERIMQAVLFYADSVGVRASADAQVSKNHIRRLKELVEIGALTTWAHEYEVTDGGRLKDRRWALNPGAIHKVLSLEEIRRLASEVDEELAVSSDDAYSDSHLRQGVSEVVQLRYALAMLRTTDALGAEGILATNDGRGGIAQQIAAATGPDIRAADIVQTIVSKCSFSSLAELPLKAVVEARTHVPAFRNYLQSTADASPKRAPDEIAQEIVQSYRRIADIQRARLPRSSLPTTWQSVGAALPASFSARALSRRIYLFNHRRQTAPLILLSSLGKYLSGGGS